MIIEKERQKEMIVSYRQLRDLINKVCTKYGVTNYLLCAVIEVESDWDTTAHNPNYHAYGLCQIVSNEVFPERPSEGDLYNPEINLEWGAKILSDCIKRGNGSKERAMYYYSGGTAWSSYVSYINSYWSRFHPVMDYWKQELEGQTMIPIDMSKYPRPTNDTGVGVHAGANAYHPLGDNEGLYRTILDEMYRCGIRWVKLLDADGSSYNACKKTLEMGMMPVVRLYRHRTYPGTLTEKQKQIVPQLVSLGVRYVERGNEPNVDWEWQSGTWPGYDWNMWTTSTFDKLAREWYEDAQVIADAGGFPAIDACSPGGHYDDTLYTKNFLAAIKRMGMGPISLLKECGWIAVHPAGLNHPTNYPDDPVNQKEHPGQTIDSLFNEKGLPTGASNCVRKWEAIGNLFYKEMGFLIPIMATEGGYWPRSRNDNRYPEVDVWEQESGWSASQLNYKVLTEMRNNPSYYMANMPWLWFNRLGANVGEEAEGFENDAWKRIPGYGNCPVGDPANQALLRLLEQDPPIVRLEPVPPTPPEPPVPPDPGDDYKELMKKSLNRVPATLKATNSVGLCWLDEFNDGVYYYGVAQVPNTYQYKLVVVDPKDWSVVRVEDWK